MNDQQPEITHICSCADQGLRRAIEHIRDSWNGAADRASSAYDEGSYRGSAAALDRALTENPELISPAEDDGGCDQVMAPEKTHLCGSDGGRGIGAGHVCTCVRRFDHPLDSERPHGCSCGALWACSDCADADPYEGCAACGASPAHVATPPGDQP